MRTARPTTGSALPVFEAGTAPFDPARSCFRFFGRLDPADPLIARKRRNILPRLQRFRVGGQRLFQVGGKVMDHTARDLSFAQGFAPKSCPRLDADHHALKAAICRLWGKNRPTLLPLDGAGGLGGEPQVSAGSLL
jgi:hypothetical protein